MINDDIKVTINNNMYGVYTVRDRLASNYGGLLVFQNDAVAERNFRNFCKKEPNAVDFELYNVGSWDVASGTLVTFAKPIYMIGGAEFIGGIKDE